MQDQVLYDSESPLGTFKQIDECGTFPTMSFKKKKKLFHSDKRECRKMPQIQAGTTKQEGGQ